MEFPKDSAWHSPKGPIREALERRALPPRLRFVSEALVSDTMGMLLFCSRLLVVGLFVSLGEFEEHDFLALVVDIVRYPVGADS
jgi:hypothetical protein